MADDFVTNPGSGGVTFASDDIGGVHWVRYKPAVGPDGTAIDVSHQAPMPVAEGLVDPKRSQATAVAVVAGGSADLDSAQVGAGMTGELLMVKVAASVPISAELKTVADGVATLVEVDFSPLGSLIFSPPAKRFVRQAHSATAGLDGFRVTVTNRYPGTRAADVHATFYWDEVA